jgi:hypothetical protein
VPGYLAIIAGKDEYLVDQDGRACYDKARKAAGPDAEAEIISAQILRVDDARVLELQFAESVKTLSMFGGKRVIGGSLRLDRHLRHALRRPAQGSQLT